MKNIRLEDIAKRLNLSKVSISKALRDHPDISIKTRKKIKKAAKEMGYHPNQVARSLASKKTRIIGVIVPKIAHFFFSYVIEGIYNAVIENDYDVILGVSLENGELEDKHLESFLQMRVDGLLVSISQETKNPAKFEAAKEMGIKLVFFDRVFEDAGFHAQITRIAENFFKILEPFRSLPVQEAPCLFCLRDTLPKKLLYL
jgi:LacI family transcriptional regulator